jgi:flagellar basal-body rod protein FlgG
MIRALYSAASGMDAQQTNVENISHNLANASTVGYKARSAQFQDLLYQTITQPGSAASTQTTVPTGLQIGLGTRVSSNGVSFAQGSLSSTGNKFDLAIQGNGFFQVRRSSGEIAYTRNGQLTLDRDGNLVTSDGDPIEPSITIPAEAQSVSIATDGTVSYTLTGQTSTQLAGQIQLANFTNPAGLNSLGSSLYAATNASGEATVGTPGGQEGLGTILQGYLEQSNVSIVTEFVNLIVSQRAYEANSKVVKAADEMYQQVNNMTR